MKHIFLFSIVSLLFINLTGCDSQKAGSQWLNTTISIDGSSRDWKDLTLTFNEDLKLVYGIANNDASLNLMFRFSDRNLANKLARRGVTLWFNENNEKKKLLGIHYVNESVRSLKPRMEGGSGRNLTPDQKTGSQQLNVHTGTFTLALNDSKNGTAIKSIRGLEAAAGYNNGLYCFEFRVSLNASKKTIHSLSLPADGKIKVCLEIGPISKEEKDRIEKMMTQQNENGGRGSGGRGGGMKGGSRSGRGGGGKGGHGSQMQTPNTDSQEIWITVMLADKNTLQD